MTAWQPSSPRPWVPARPAVPAVEEMTEVGELRVRLRRVEHDLEHVVRERDQSAAEAARLRAVVARVETLARLAGPRGVVAGSALNLALDGIDG